jgi:hypothetical protein
MYIANDYCTFVYLQDEFWTSATVTARFITAEMHNKIIHTNKYIHMHQHAVGAEI